MSDAALKRLPLAVFGLIVAMGVLGFVLKGRVTADDVFGIPFFAFATVGAVVAVRQPRNPVGWIFMVVGLTPTTGFFTGAYAGHSLQTAGGLPGATFVEWVSSWAWFPGIGLLATFGFLLFPNGGLPSRRWRVVPYLAATWIAVITLSMALLPGPMEPFDPTLPSSVNPYGLESAGEVIESIEGAAFSGFPLLALLCVASLGFRYRSATSDQRQQIKWFAYSAFVLFLAIAFENVVEGLVGDAVAQSLFFIGMIFPSVGAGIGILKYRLYDIDVVINRTLVYGSLTAILAGTYLGIVVLLQQALGGFTADSDLAIAGSTLAVAALFRPLRSRVQTFIDRRFYRRKYDATETLSRFSSRLRDQVDLESLKEEIVGVVGETVQPAHVSVWLRAGTGVTS